jgi:hypothetical protein
VTTTLAITPEGSPEIDIDREPTAETAIFTEPDLVVSCVDVAVTVAVPAAEGVNTPAEVIVPPVADQVTPEL